MQATAARKQLRFELENRKKEKALKEIEEAKKREEKSEKAKKKSEEKKLEETKKKIGKWSKKENVGIGNGQKCDRLVKLY